MWTVILLLSSVLAQGPNEAEQLFRKMEEKLAKAKTLKVSFEGKASLEGKADVLSVKGLLLVAEGNKARFEGTMKAGDKPAPELVILSDGAKATDEGDKPPKRTFPVPEKYSERILISTCRAGAFATFLNLGFDFETGPRNIDVRKSVRVSDFQLGNKEKVGDKEALVIEYTVAILGQKGPNRCILWIDANTLLPLKRKLTETQGNRKDNYVETYAEFVLDAKIDAKKFEIPK